MPHADLISEGKSVTIYYEISGADSTQEEGSNELAPEPLNQTGLVDSHVDTVCGRTPQVRVLSNRASADGQASSGGTENSLPDCRNADDNGRSTSRGADLDPCRVLIIAGLGARGRTEFFQHVVAHWANLRDVNGNKKLSICTFDARGIGKSSSPSKLRQYSTHLMASDAIALLEHIGWVQTHIVGLSLGGMVACKLAAMSPSKVASLSLIATTASGWHMLAGISTRPLLAGLAGSGPLKWKIPANLRYNFSEHYLTETGKGGKSRMEVLVENTYKAIEERDSGKFLAEGQSDEGRRGHLAAVIKHRMKAKELKTLREAAFPCQVIVGRHDKLARTFFVNHLAQQLRAAFLIVEAGHAGILIEAMHAILPVLETFLLGTAHTHALRIDEIRLQTDNQVLQDRIFAKEFLSSFAPGRVSFKLPQSRNQK